MANKRGIETVDLNSDINASVRRLEELRNNREQSMIPHTDEYWKALKKHRVAFNPNKGEENGN